jgi:hypothetical protein
MKNILLPALTLLYCLNGFAQELATATEKKDDFEEFYSDSDTIKGKKREVLKEDN